MARLDIGDDDLRTLIGKWDALADGDGIFKRAVYDGAHVVYESLQASIDSIPKDRVSDKMKEELKSHLGSSSIYKQDTYIGEAFTEAGYADDPKRKGGQVPVAMVARSINAGTSTTKPYRFIDKAFKTAKDAAEKAMKQTFEDDLQKAFDEGE